MVIGSPGKVKNTDKSGFSLIELAILIAVAATVAVGYLALVQPEQALKSNSTLKTLERMHAIIDALEGYRVKYGRLPCPADPLTRSDNTNEDGSTPMPGIVFGSERLNLDQTDGNVGIDCPVQSGSIPFRSMGLKPEFMFDGWNRRFTYHVSANLCGVGTDPTAENDGCTPFNYAENEGDIIVSDGGANVTDKAAYVIVSHGPNGLGAFLPSGAQLANTGGVNEQENTDGDITYVMTSGSAVYDDIVMYRTKDFVNEDATDVVSKLVTLENCIANSEQMATITKTVALDINTYVTALAPHDGSTAILTMMWALQDECETNYGLDGTDPRPEWYDVTTGLGGKKCPGEDINGATYNAGDHTCDCPSGDWDAC